MTIAFVFFGVNGETNIANPTLFYVFRLNPIFQYDYLIKLN